MEPHFLYPNAVPNQTIKLINITSGPSGLHKGKEIKVEKFWPEWAKCVSCNTSESSADYISLPCLHVLCSGSCVKRIVSVSDCCPLCNATFKKGDLTPNKYLLEAFEKELEAQKKANLRCTYCYGGDPALSWCATCTNYLCEWCDKNHRRMKITCDHDLRSKEEGEKSHLDGPGSNNHCAAHPENPLTCYCTTCDLCLCQKCIETPCYEGNYHTVVEMERLAMKLKEEIQSAQNQISSYIEECRIREGRYGELAQSVIEVHRKRLYNEFKDQLNKFYVILMKKEAELRTTILKEIRVRNKRFNLKKSLYHKMAIQGEHFVEITKDLIKNGSDITLFNSKDRLIENKNMLLENFELITIDDKSQDFNKEAMVVPDPNVFHSISAALDKFGIMSAATDRKNKDGGNSLDPKTKAAELELLKIKNQKLTVQRENSIAKLTALYGVPLKLPLSHNSSPLQAKRSVLTKHLNFNPATAGKSNNIVDKTKIINIPSSVMVLPSNSKEGRTRASISKNPQMLKVTDLIDANKRGSQAETASKMSQNQELINTNSNYKIRVLSENSMRAINKGLIAQGIKSSEPETPRSEFIAPQIPKDKTKSCSISPSSVHEITPPKQIVGPARFKNGPVNENTSVASRTRMLLSNCMIDDVEEGNKERPVSPRKSIGLSSLLATPVKQSRSDELYKIAPSPGGLKMNFKKIDSEITDDPPSPDDGKPRIREGRRKQNFTANESRTTIDNSEPVIEITSLEQEEQLDMVETENINKKQGRKSKSQSRRISLGPSSPSATPIKKTQRTSKSRYRSYESDREETPPPILDKEGSFEESPTNRKSMKRVRDYESDDATGKRRSTKSKKKKIQSKPEVLADLDVTLEFQIFQEEQMKITHIDQNEDYCAVCRDGCRNIGNEVLICCDFCPKVFHTKCHMPIVDIVPNDDWQCMYCRKKEDIFAEAAAEAPSAIKITRRINGYNLLKACKFLSEIYKQKESLILRGPYELYYFNKTGEKPYSLDFVRTCLTTARPKSVSDIESLIQMMRKMIFQAKELFTNQPQNLSYTTDLERVFQVTLQDFFPEFADSKYLEEETSIEEEDKERAELSIEPSE